MEDIISHTFLLFEHGFGLELDGGVSLYAFLITWFLCGLRLSKYSTSIVMSHRPRLEAYP